MYVHTYMWIQPYSLVPELVQVFTFDPLAFFFPFPGSILMHVHSLHPSPCQSEPLTSAPNRMDSVWTGKAFALY